MDMAKDESGNYKVDEVKKADASVKTMADFTSPDILYKELIDSVKKYHPSTDISMLLTRRIKGSFVSPVSLISFTLSVWQSFWRIWSWTRRVLWLAFFMMWWRIRS